MRKQETKYAYRGMPLTYNCNNETDLHGNERPFLRKGVILYFSAYDEYYSYDTVYVSLNQDLRDTISIHRSLLDIDYSLVDFIETDKLEYCENLEEVNVGEQVVFCNSCTNYEEEKYEIGVGQIVEVISKDEEEDTICVRNKLGREVEITGWCKIDERHLKGPEDHICIQNPTEYISYNIFLLKDELEEFSTHLNEMLIKESGCDNMLDKEVLFALCEAYNNFIRKKSRESGTSIYK